MLIQTSGEDEWVAGRRVGSRPPRASVERRFLIRSLARGSPPPTQEGEPSSKTGRPQDIFRQRLLLPNQLIVVFISWTPASQAQWQQCSFPKIEFRARLGESMHIFTAQRYFIRSTLDATSGGILALASTRDFLQHSFHFRPLMYNVYILHSEYIGGLK